MTVRTSKACVVPQFVESIFFQGLDGIDVPESRESQSGFECLDEACHLSSEQWFDDGYGECVAASPSATQATAR